MRLMPGRPFDAGYLTKFAMGACAAVTWGEALPPLASDAWADDCVALVLQEARRLPDFTAHVDGKASGARPAACFSDEVSSTPQIPAERDG